MMILGYSFLLFPGKEPRVSSLSSKREGIFYRGKPFPPPLELISQLIASSLFIPDVRLEHSSLMYKKKTSTNNPPALLDQRSRTLSGAVKKGRVEDI